MNSTIKLLMDLMFIEVRKVTKPKVDSKVINDLKMFKKVGLVGTIQELDNLQYLKRSLQKKGINVLVPQGNFYKGHILGCDSHYCKDCDCFLYLGDGMFHPLALYIKHKKPVYIFYKKQFLEEKEANKLIKKRIINKELVLSSRIIGILISTKIGQNRLQQAIKLGKELKKSGKEIYFFVGDNVDDTIELNFPKIEAWINTMCPRIVDDYIFKKPIVNIGDLVE